MPGLFDDLIDAPASGGLFDDLIDAPAKEEYPDQVSRAASRPQPAAEPVALGGFGGEESAPQLLPDSVLGSVTRNAPAPTSLAGAGGFAAASAARNAERNAPAKARTSQYDFETSAAFKGDDKEEEIGAFLGAVAMAKQYQGMRRVIAEFTGDETTRDDAALQREMYGRKEEAAKNENATAFEKNLSGAISSIVTQAPALFAGLATGGASAVPLTAMWVQTFGDEYSNAREAGKGKVESAVRGGIFGTAEVVGEMVGIGSTMKAAIGAAKKAPAGEIAEHLAKALLADLPGEQATHLMEFVADKSETIGLRPNATLADFLKGAGDTLVQTVLQSGMMAGGIGGLRTARGLADQGAGTAAAADQSIAEFRAEEARTNALDKAAETFGGMKLDTPDQAKPIAPYSGPSVTVPGQQHPPAPPAPPVPPAQSSAPAAGMAAPASLATEVAPTPQPAAPIAPGPATQAGAAPQTAAQIEIDPNNPAASIAAIAAAPITQVGVGVSAPAGLDAAAHGGAAGDLAATFMEISALRRELKITPPKMRPAVQERIDQLTRGARATLELYEKQNGKAAAGNLHRAAAETFLALKGDYSGLRVQKPGAFTNPEQGSGLNVEVPDLNAKAPPVTIPTPIGAAPAKQPEAGDLPKIELPGATQEVAPEVAAAETSAEAGVQRAAMAQTYPGSVEARAIHYGNVPGLAALSGRKYGTGASHWNGEERTRLEGSQSAIKQRVYFYEREGMKLPEPEGVVTGTHVYETKIPGLLDVQSKTAQDLMKATPRDQLGRLDLNKFEEAVLAAGYAGYKNGNQIVTLGRDVPVRYLGTRFEALKAEREAAAKPAASPTATATAEATAAPAAPTSVAREHRLHPKVALQVTKEASNEHAKRIPELFVKSQLGTSRAPTPTEKRILGRIFEAMLKTGIRPELLSGLSGVHVYEGQPGVNAHHEVSGDTRVIGFTEEFMRHLVAGDTVYLNSAVLVTIHELWHEQDTDWSDSAGWTSYSETSPLYEIGGDRAGRVPVGAIMKEVMAFYERDPAGLSSEERSLMKWLDYPLGMWHDDLGTRYEADTTRLLKYETAAQLWSAWYSMPDLVERVFPTAAARFKEMENGYEKLGPSSTAEQVRAVAGDVLHGRAHGTKPAGVAQQGQAGVPGAERESRQPSNRELTEQERTTVFENLTPDERRKLNTSKNRKGAAQQLLDIFLGMPSSKETAAIAWAGRAKRGWYRQAAYALHHVFGTDAPRFAALLAATSPQTKVQVNLKAALLIWVEWNKRGKPVEWEAIERLVRRSAGGTGIVITTDMPNIIRSLTHPDPAQMLISGPKVNSFFKNLIGDVVEVTNDAWMAAYAAVAPKLFGGQSTPIAKQLVVTDQGKQPGYLAMSVHARQAAKILTERTGDQWTPAEVQETVWSWAKTLYEMASTKKSAEEILNDQELTDELINSTPDFGSLLSTGEYAGILAGGGFQKGLAALAEARRASDENAGKNPYPERSREKAPFATGVQRIFERRAARRLDQLREERNRAEAEAKARAAARAAAIQAAGDNATARALAGVGYDPNDPANANAFDFQEVPEEAVKKPGWAIVTGTVEGRPQVENDQANAALASRLTALGYQFETVQGVWRGVDQGTSYLVYAPTEAALQLAKEFKQEAITTAKGFEYTDGRIEAADHSKDAFGEEAMDRDGYTIMPDGTAISLGFKGPFAAENRSSVVESNQLAGDGRWSTKFFTEASEGKRAPDAKVPYVPTLDISDVADFSAEYVKHRGNFDDHIATSIPGFREVQQAVGAAIVKSYPDGAQLLDIAASEGAFNKAITATSGGKIKTLALDPNLKMAEFFRTHSQVPGAEYSIAAFGSAEQAGQEAWTEDDGTVIKFFDPPAKYDVVHESMGFQFISNTRNAQFSRAKEMMAPNGIALFEEKVIDDTALWRSNEKKKDAYKARYYTQAQLEAKKAEVLELGKEKAAEAESKREQDVVGMNNLMTTSDELEQALKRNWKFVSQYWSSGNFKGYVASDSQAAVQRFLDNLVDLNSEYSNVKTPRTVGRPMHDLSVPVTVIAIEAETGRNVEVTMPASEALASLDQDIDQTERLLECLSS